MSRSSKLLNALCCPDCRSELTLAADVYQHDELESGQLYCPKCKHVAADVKDFQFDFMHFDRRLADERYAARGGSYIPQRLATMKHRTYEIPANDSRISYSGKWEMLGSRMMSFTKGSKATIRVRCKNLAVSLLNHDWSGNVRLALDGVQREFDLYSSDSHSKVYTLAEDLEYGVHKLEIEALGTQNRLSHHSQVAIDWAIVTENDNVPYNGRVVLNRGNSYPKRFEDMIPDVPADGLILDVGGGDRQYPDERYFNIEYMKFELPNIFADCHRIPFRDNSVDLLLSQAVMEHVYDPQLAVSELYRVLKPGGKCHVEAAFMQPLHAVPHHYFNLTLFGLEHLFSKFEKLDSGCFGNLNFTLDWMMRAAHVDLHMGRKKYEKLQKVFAELESHVDAQLLHTICSAVYFKGRKPVTKE